MSMRDFWDIVKEVIEESDVIVEVLDARMPELTRNKDAERLAKLAGKPLILVINKADLVSEKTVKQHRQTLDKTFPCVSVSSRERRGITLLKKKIFEIVKKRSRPGEFLKIGVIGYPNTGKSSLINALAGRRRAKTGPRPGQTRGFQWVRVSSDVGLIDTPGIIPLTGEDSELKHALIGTLDPSKIADPEAVAREIVTIFLDSGIKRLEEFYSIKIGDKEFEDIIEEIGKARNMLKKGGKIDEKRVYFALINDWQRGKLLLKSM